MMLKPRKHISFFIRAIPVVLFLVSCGGQHGEKDEGDRIVAEVYNKQLKAKEVNAFIPSEATKDDSLAIARNYIERWVRDALLIREAEKQVSKDLAIDQLVKRYRTQLILSNYEKEFVEKNLDTLVSLEELQKYYDENKEQYLLETTIIRCRFMKLSKDITPRDKEFIVKNWKSDKPADIRYMKRVCKDFGEGCLFDEQAWLKLDQIKNMLPPGTINNSVIQYNREFTFRDSDYYYYLYVYEYVADKELAPFTFIEEQARKYILYRRKLKLLEEMKESLYEQETGTNNVKIYTD